MGNRPHATILVDNAPAPGLCTEWGLSAHIAYGDLSVLLDFGQTDAFVQNATALGIDLAQVDFAVLSHAHYDHADGMGAFFERNAHASLYLSEACAETCWSTKGGNIKPHYIGVSHGLLEYWYQRIVAVPTDCVTTLAPGVHLVPHTTPGLAEAGERAGMLLRESDGWHPDGFAHELSLVFELGDDDLAVFNSCSHAGLGVIAREVCEAFPGRRIATFVGGLHLMRSDDEAILDVAHTIREAHIGQVWCGHCTGDHAIELLQRELPDCVHAFRSGSVIEL